MSLKKGEGRDITLTKQEWEKIADKIEAYKKTGDKKRTYNYVESRTPCNEGFRITYSAAQRAKRKKQEMIFKRVSFILCVILGIVILVWLTVLALV